MDNLISAFINWQFGMFCVALVAFTQVVRTTVEYILTKFNKEIKTNKLWLDVVVPSIPIVAGSLGALLAKQYPYPLEIVSASGRFAFGLSAGLLCMWLFKIIKALVVIQLNALKNKVTSATGTESADITDNDATTPAVADTKTDTE